MRVLIFMTQFYQLSGAERLAVELAEQLNKRGIHTDIMSMYTEGLPGVVEAKRELLDRGIPSVHFLGMRIHPSLGSLVPSIRNLRRTLRREQYDIVETSMISPTVIAAWATRGTPVQHVAGLHQVFRRDRENGFRHRVWRFSVGRNRHIQYYAVSDCAADSWIRYSSTPPGHTRTIYNAIPEDCFDAAPDRSGVHEELGIPDDGGIALYVGRLAKYKGCDTLLDALGPVLRQNSLYLLFAGAPDPTTSGTMEMIRRMEKDIEKERWGEYVRFLGHQKNIPRLLASVDLLVHAPRMEGFGLVLAEAMAAGLPVVASNVEGIPEVLEGTDSLIVPPDDPELFRKAVLKSLNRSAAEIARAKVKGRERAGAFRIETRTDAMVRLFAELL